MSLFHNPYTFIPASPEPGPGEIEIGHDRRPDQWPDAKCHPHLSHAWFAPNTLSGRIVCRLTLEGPMACGNNQDASDKQNQTPRVLHLFQLSGSRQTSGMPEFAIAGSSLRGLISSMAEAASNSTFRVLHNTELSFIPGRKANRINLGKKWDYFRKFNKNLIPLSKGDTRSTLTLAEQLFGFVEQSTESQDEKDPEWRAFTLAGRVKFSNALSNGVVVQQKEQVSKILDSPKKSGYASFYFQNDNGTGDFIPRKDLKPAKHEPKGRKIYLHHPESSNENPAWVSLDPNEQAHEKARVAPLSKGEFWFHLDFDNLTDLELNLLCYAIRPSEAFRHKIGMGKPLGMGRVRLDPVALCMVDRKCRYLMDDLEAPRYHATWKNESIPNSHWHKNYQAEQQTASSASPSPFERRDAYRKSLHNFDCGNILRAIELAGDPGKISHPVHYPQPMERSSKGNSKGAKSGNTKPVLIEGIEMERKGFEWFMKNEDKQGQYLQPLDSHHTCDFTEVPLLEREELRDPPLPSCLEGKSQRPFPSPRSSQRETLDDLRGSVREFVAEVHKRDKIRFSTQVGDKPIYGFFQYPAQLQKLQMDGLKVGDKVKLKILSIDLPGLGKDKVFKLALPEEFKD